MMSCNALRIFYSFEFSMLSFLFMNSIALRCTIRKKKRQRISSKEVDKLNVEEDTVSTGFVSSQQIKEFLDRGVIVVRNVLDSDEILKSREGRADFDIDLCLRNLLGSNSTYQIYICYMVYTSFLRIKDHQ